MDDRPDTTEAMELTMEFSLNGVGVGTMTVIGKDADDLNAKLATLTKSVELDPGWNSAICTLNQPRQERTHD